MTKRTINQLSVDPNTDQKRKKENIKNDIKEEKDFRHICNGAVLHYGTKKESQLREEELLKYWEEKKMCKTQYEVPLEKHIVSTHGQGFKGLAGFIHYNKSKYRRFKIYFEKKKLRFEIEYEADEDIEFREFRSFKDAVDFFLVEKEVKDGYQKIYKQSKENISAGLDKTHTAFLNDEETYVLVKCLF
jgi:hypothetical protein